MSKPQGRSSKGGIHAGSSAQGSVFLRSGNYNSGCLAALRLSAYLQFHALRRRNAIVSLQHLRVRVRGRSRYSLSEVKHRTAPWKEALGRKRVLKPCTQKVYLSFSWNSTRSSRKSFCELTMHLMSWKLKSLVLLRNSIEVGVHPAAPRFIAPSENRLFLASALSSWSEFTTPWLISYPRCF